MVFLASRRSLFGSERSMAESSVKMDDIVLAECGREVILFRTCFNSGEDVLLELED